MFKSNNPTAAQVEFYQRLEELIESKPDDVDVLCFVSMKITEYKVSGICMLKGGVTGLGMCISKVISKDLKIRALMQTGLFLSGIEMKHCPSVANNRK